MRAQNKAEFIDVCLRKLGAPVIDINVDEDQVEDRVYEALIYYYTYHYDASEQLSIVYQITADDITNQYIKVPENILSVKKVIIDNNNLLSGGFGTNIWHGMQAMMYDIGFGMGAGRGGLTNYSMMMTYLSELGFQFDIKETSSFNYRSHRIYINTNWKNLTVGSIIFLEVYRMIDGDENPDMWADTWLQEYATALIGLQWGTNLSKFDGVELPSGITLNGDKIYDRYLAVKTDLEEKMQESWETPPMFVVG